MSDPTASLVQLLQPSVVHLVVRRHRFTQLLAPVTLERPAAGGNLHVTEQHHLPARPSFRRLRFVPVLSAVLVTKHLVAVDRLTTQR